MKCCFPLFDLPDSALADVLQRCPPGSIAGFSLPLALAQVRVTGSVDPHWLRPLLHLASKCPVVLDRLTPHLRSINAPPSFFFKGLVPIAPKLTRLEELRTSEGIPVNLLAALPTSLTRLCMWAAELDDSSPEALAALVLRLTALEDLDLGHVLKKDLKECWVMGGALPRLRRLRIRGFIPEDLEELAPNLEALEVQFGSENMPRLPSTLTELRYSFCPSREASMLHLTRLDRLRHLGVPSDMDFAELPVLLRALTALTMLRIEDYTEDDKLPLLVEVVDAVPDGLDICLLDRSSAGPPVLSKRLFEHLVDARLKPVCDADLLHWAALTRLTRLELEVDGSMSPSWVQPLSQLPSLRDLDVRLIGQVPAGFGALTQCTKLGLRDIESTANLSCLQRLTRLRECFCIQTPVESLAALPACLTHLHALAHKAWPSESLGEAIQHLTALEDLTVEWPEGEVCDLFAQQRLTSLRFDGCPDTLARLETLVHLRACDFFYYESLEEALLQQLGRLSSLRELDLGCQILTGADLTSLTSLSKLEYLRLPVDDMRSVTLDDLLLLLDHLPLLAYMSIWDPDPAGLEDPALPWTELSRLAGDRLVLEYEYL